MNTHVPVRAYERTEIQKVANELDMEMHWLVCRMERFADMLSTYPRQSKRILSSAVALHHARREVREYMHRKDIEATS